VTPSFRQIAFDGRFSTDRNACRLEAYAERWRPWRAYAVLYLWESLSAQTDALSRAV